MSPQLCWDILCPCPHSGLMGMSLEGSSAPQIWFFFSSQGEPGAPGNKGDTGAKGEPVSDLVMCPPKGGSGPRWLRPLSGVFTPPGGLHPSASPRRVPLVSKAPPAPLERKEREEPVVSPAPLGCPALLVNG